MVEVDEMGAEAEAEQRSGTPAVAPVIAATPKVPPARNDKRAKGDTIVRGTLNMTSTADSTKYVYIPDKFLLGDASSNLSVATLFNLVGLRPPSLIFRVANGGTVDEWHMLRPPASGDEALEDAVSGDEELEKQKLAHFRRVIQMKMLRIFSQTVTGHTRTRARNLAAPLLTA